MRRAGWVLGFVVVLLVGYLAVRQAHEPLCGARPLPYDAMPSVAGIHSTTKSDPPDCGMSYQRVYRLTASGHVDADSLKADLVRKGWSSTQCGDAVDACVTRGNVFLAIRQFADRVEVYAEPEKGLNVAPTGGVRRLLWALRVTD